MLRIMLLAVFTVCCTAGALAQRVLHVDQAHAQANDANPGDADRPFKTIGAALAVVAPGDTVQVRAGIYRETLQIRRNGEAGRPITLMGAPGERVTVTGADAIRNWRRCTAEDAKGNPHHGKLFVVDVPFEPSRLIQNSRSGKKYALSRLPDEGMWQPTGVDGRRVIIDTANLTAKDPDAFKGWILQAYYQAGGGATAHDSFTYDPARQQITLDKDFTRWADTDPNRDTYWFENNPAGINAAGQFAWRKLGDAYRIWVWPLAMDGDQPDIEAVVRDQVIQLNNTSWYVFYNLDIAYARGQGIGYNARLTDAEVRHCVIRDCGSYGISLHGVQRVTISRCLLRENSHGIIFSGAQDCAAEENDVGWNRVDGVIVNNRSSNVRIARNLIHNHVRFGHPDGIQTWGGVDNLLVQDNVLLYNGQQMMTGGMTRFRVINNIIIGSHAIAAISGGTSGTDVYNLRGAALEERNKRINAFLAAEPDQIEFIGNTIVATPASPTNWTGQGYTVRDNIIAPLNGGIPMYQATRVDRFKADHNLLWPGANYTGAVAIVGEVARKGQGDAAELDMARHWTPWATLREKWGLEKNGVLADPMFANVPRHYTVSHHGKVARGTRSSIVVSRRQETAFPVGDTIEIGFDGVARRVTRLDRDGNDTVIHFEPALPKALIRAHSVANWGDAKDLRWDVRLRPGSPAIGKASTGGNIGSSVDMHAYLRGDFTGDGQRDIPSMPYDEQYD